VTRPAIVSEGIGKMYRLGASRVPYRTLRETITGAFDGLRRPGMSRRTEFWALRDVSFEAKEGDVLGVIGHNGAGKSTLLKILSRVTEPSCGRAALRGRVGSLLEVGTGFHPELTGRENVYLSGAILGMRRSEIERKFDAIVSFSGVEEFLDTPVKRYSSGMYVRLAFSVAAHLEPEILIVDEVLAVGDAAFQQKCLGKMGQVAGEGRTVLLVSHNLAAIARLCTKALLLTNGTSRYFDSAQQAIQEYVGEAFGAPRSRVDLVDAPRLDADRPRLLRWAAVCKEDGTETGVFSTGDTMVVRIGYRVEQELLAYVQVNVVSVLRERIMTISSTQRSTTFLLSGEGHIECILPDMRLASGQYFLEFEIGRSFPRQWLDNVPSALPFRVEIGDYLGGEELPPAAGAVVQPSAWRDMPSLVGTER
jgi:lipopolysaccharide transport system ATP-binding protein